MAEASGHVLPCPWCLSTPPRCDRCQKIVFNPNRRKTGTTLDRNGAIIPTYDGPLWVDCPCPCRSQGQLW